MYGRLDALSLRLSRHLTGLEPLDQIRDIGELLLEIALIRLQALEDVLAVVPPLAQAAMEVPSVSVVHSSPPFVPFEKAVDPFAGTTKCSRPLVEQAPALGTELVGALRGPRGFGLPFPPDDPVLLQRAQNAVQVPHVDARFADHVRQRLEELVPVRGPLPQEQQQRGLAEPFHPRAHAPLTVAEPPAAAGAPASARPHASPTCKTHMCRTVAAEPQRPSATVGPRWRN